MGTLKELLQNDGPVYALEAHNGISARIAEEAGFKTIWASGFTMAASLAHRDCNELSWTEICNQLEYMASATDVPILVDGDTGFGNFNNVRVFVKKLCRLGIAGVCLEDKVFPKTNSFIPHNQTLTSIPEFQGKIRAAKDTQADPDFVVIARTEAFIAQKSVEEALERAYAYRDAGADGILVHSKKPTIEEIELFCKGWDYSIPLIVVPTSYSNTPPEVFQNLNISMVIWANQILRAAISAMKLAAQEIYQNRSTARIETHIASMNDLFKLVNEEELREAEKKYASV